MNTKTPGDILAERIERVSKSHFPDTPVSRLLDNIIAEYRKPWTLGRSVKGFRPLADGEEWHRQDFTEDMLPDGWRPTLMGENVFGTDEGLYDEWASVAPTRGHVDVGLPLDCVLYRTRRPLPAVEKWAAEKAAFLRGEKIEIHNGTEWIEFAPRNRHDPPPWTEDYLFRVKPEPVMVPLGPEDVPPGSVLRHHSWKAFEHVTPSVFEHQVEFIVGESVAFRTYERLRSEPWSISRDGGETWSRCEKEAK